MIKREPTLGQKQAIQIHENLMSKLQGIQWGKTSNTYCAGPKLPIQKEALKGHLITNKELEAERI